MKSGFFLQDALKKRQRLRLVLSHTQMYVSEVQCGDNTTNTVTRPDYNRTLRKCACDRWCCLHHIYLHFSIAGTHERFHPLHLARWFSTAETTTLTRKKNRRDCLLRVPHRIGDTFARRLKCVANFQTTSNFSLWSFCARSVVLRHIEQPFPRRSLLHYGLPKCPSWISSLASTFAPTVLSLGRRAIGLSLVTLFEIKKNIVVLVCSGQNPRCSTFVRTPRIIAHRCSVRFTGSVGWKPSIPKPVKNVKILVTCRSISFFFHCRKHLLHISQFVMLPRFVVQLLRLVADLPVIALLLSLSLQPLRRGRNITCLFKIPSTRSAWWLCAERLLVLRHWWCACPRPSSGFLQMAASSPSYFLRSSALPIHSHAHPNWCPSTRPRCLLQRNTNHSHFRSCFLLPSKSQHLPSASVQATAGFSQKFEHNTRLPCPLVSRASSPCSFHLGYDHWLPCSYPQTCSTSIPMPLPGRFCR